MDWNRKYPGRIGADTAFWRGDYTELWVIAVTLGVLATALAALLHYRPYFYGWIAIGAGLIGVWISTVIYLIPRSAKTYEDMGKGGPPE